MLESCNESLLSTINPNIMSRLKSERVLGILELMVSQHGENEVGEMLLRNPRILLSKGECAI